MDIATVTARELEAIVAAFSGPNTRRITDYLNGHQLGRRQMMEIRDATGKLLGATDLADRVGYWAGDLLPSTDPRYGRQVEALIRSFTFRNILLECVETLVDGIGIDEPDWSLGLSRPLKDGEQPTTDEAALISEAEALLTAWWDRRDLPSLLLRTAVMAVAHGRQPIRPRVPTRFMGADGRLKPGPLEKSLDGLHLELPDPADSGLYLDPETLERYGVTRVWVNRPGGGLESTWEIGRTDEQGRSILRTVSGRTASDSQAVDLGEIPWLFELKFWRGAATPDALSIQDSLNVGLTNLSRNTRWASFEKLIMVGIEPPLDDEGRPQNPSGPGSASYLQPTVAKETELKEADEGATETVREKMFTGASVEHIQPSEPKAIQALIDQAIRDMYAVMRQSFQGMGDQATASGRSREVATGPYLRAVARYAVACESLIRDILLFALKFSALSQGKPGRYDGLRVTVACRQKVFEPSSETIAAMHALQQTGVISMQTLRTIAGVADPDAEQQLIEREAATAPSTTQATPSQPEDKTAE